MPRRWSVALLCLLAFSHSPSATADPAGDLAAHALNRAAYGHDAWSRAQVEKHPLFGHLLYLAGQIEPAILDDSAVDALLAGYPSLTMTYEELRANYCNSCPLGNSSQPRKELAAAKILRAIASRRQLEALMTDFWTNWFNVDARGGLSQWGVVPFERDAIRPHVFGKFENMLIAVAQSVAMLDYLDNRYNYANSLNENYGRELLELHTVGAAAHSQADVIEVARAMTGWSVDGQGFLYRDDRHDTGEKVVMGELVIPAGGGMDDGITLLTWLARHPLTAQRACERLVGLLTAERDPWPRMVNKCTATWIGTDGNLKAVVAELMLVLHRGRTQPNTMVRQPLHLVASTYRALGVTPDAGRLQELIDDLRNMGHAPFEAGPPTGYPQVSAPWASAGGLVNRFNLVWDVIQNEAPDLGISDGTPEEIVDFLAPRLLFGPLSSESRAQLVAYLESTDNEPGATRVSDAAALLLSFPEFQRR